MWPLIDVSTNNSYNERQIAARLKDARDEDNVSRLNQSIETPKMKQRALEHWIRPA